MVSELEALEWWQRALKDAQVMGDSVLLYSIDHTDRGTDDYGPRYVPKRAEIGFSRHVAEPLGHDKDCRRLETAVGRVFVRLDESVPVVAAQMRHELEHFLQVEAIGDFGGWYEEIKGRIQSAGLREQEGKLYNLIPAEVDANRAASRFARCWFGEAIPELSQGANGVLFWHSDDPGPLSSLMDRMAEFDDSLDAHIGDRRSAGN